MTSWQLIYYLCLLQPHSIKLKPRRFPGPRVNNKQHRGFVWFVFSTGVCEKQQKKKKKKYLICLCCCLCPEDVIISEPFKWNHFFKLMEQNIFVYFLQLQTVTKPVTVLTVTPVTEWSVSFKWVFTHSCCDLNWFLVFFVTRRRCRITDSRKSSQVSLHQETKSLRRCYLNTEGKGKYEKYTVQKKKYISSLSLHIL